MPGKCHGQRSLAGYRPWGRRVRHDLASKQQQRGNFEMNKKRSKGKAFLQKEQQMEPPLERDELGVFQALMRQGTG